ncbi:MAG: hypothetical protein A3J97_00155 [Spirochaetes bacterium RIFOXYC1_FULL_54_7]|nr:MAG: hypothetical protein A3J97_00155 [Spirochaetes bacterium RIFOXYC1_FULL_54_7]
MNNFNPDKALPVCKRASATLAKLENFVFDWAEAKAKLPKEFERALVPYRELVGKLPEQWIGMAQAQYVFAKTFGDPAMLAKFSKQARADLSGDGAGFVDSALEEPWRFSLFSLVDHLGGDFYTVRDHFTGTELVLNSASVTRLRHEGKRLFFALLFANPLCWQTYGIVGYFKGLSPVDISQFASLLDASLYEASGAAAVALARPVPFMVLYNYAEIPMVMHGKEPVRFYTSEVAVAEPNSIVLPETYPVEESRLGTPDVLRFRLGGEDFFEHIDFYLDLENKQAFLSAHTLGNYQKGVKLLAPYLSLPEDPQFDVGTLMYTILKDLLGFEPRGEWYDSHFTEEASQEEKAELKKINAVFARISDLRNHGGEIDADALAAQFEVEPELIRELLASVKDPDAAFPITLDYGIPGYAPPPPATRQKMQGSFEFNDLISFNTGKAVQELYARTKTDRANLLHTNNENAGAGLGEYPGILDGIYDEFWNTNDATIMNYTMYLLRENGTRPHLARDYAAEVLRIFHQVLIPDTELATIQSFTRRYARFIHGMVIPAGLAVMDGLYEIRDIRHGAFAIRATEFMRVWLKW